MAVNFKRDIIETEEVVQREEHWTTIVGDYEITIKRDITLADDLGAHEVELYSETVKAGTVRFRPKTVADLDRLAEDLPDLIRVVTAELRRQGKDQLR